MNRYLFLISWASGSDTASDLYDNGDSGVKDQKELLPQFIAENQNIFAVEITAPNKEIATAFGFKAAFFQNYTAHDSTSSTHLIDDIKDEKGNHLALPDVAEAIVVDINS